MSDLSGEIYKAVEFYSIHDKRQDKIRITENGIDEIMSMVLDKQWISVKDGLPDDGADVLVTNGERMMMSTFHGGEFSYDYRNDVTHWQPLPALPKINSLSP